MSILPQAFLVFLIYWSLNPAVTSRQFLHRVSTFQSGVIARNWYESLAPYLGHLLAVVPGWCHGQSPSSVACWNLSAHAPPKKAVWLSTPRLCPSVGKCTKNVGARQASLGGLISHNVSNMLNINLMRCWTGHLKSEVFCGPTFKTWDVLSKWLAVKSIKLVEQEFTANMFFSMSPRKTVPECQIIVALLIYALLAYRIVKGKMHYFLKPNPLWAASYNEVPLNFGLHDDYDPLREDLVNCTSTT